MGCQVPIYLVFFLQKCIKDFGFDVHWEQERWVLATVDSYLALLSSEVHFLKLSVVAFRYCCGFRS